MKIEIIRDLLNADVLCGEDRLSNDVLSACGSDMMSDVLAYVKNQAVLLTGLVNSRDRYRRQFEAFRFPPALATIDLAHILLVCYCTTAI